ncbi:DUF2599 domain-containing protein [Curtobacterium sp. MCPF17_031]|uniref:DUF2599 domain-containing protein n=1 Tax=Curtobacterium sp. MCPF17_031 TaxID=2175653 RepID=UPI0011B854C9|nr:DUF2599 domain-containing protein [Curtobacterium sp. MCPF17_031]
MKRKAWNMSSVMGVAVLATGLVASTTGVAVADTAEPAKDLDQISAVAPFVTDTMADVTASPSSSAIVDEEVAGVQVSVASKAEAGVSLSYGDRNVSVSLPETSGRTPVAKANESGAVFENKDGSSTVPVVQEDGSVVIATVISDAGAPSEYSYEVQDLGDGRLSLDENGGVNIYSADGSWNGGFAAPWAKDANGRDIPTKYEIVGNSVVQTVEHSGEGYAYPIVADPWLGISLISSVGWGTYNGAWMGKVVPTSYGRVAPIASRLAAWGETLEKPNARARLDFANTRDQFYCHYDGVRIIEPNKPSWNLERSRPNVGYAKTVAASCNP